MSTITLELDEHVAETLARAAEANHKPLSVWAVERLKAAASEDLATENGYPSSYWKLFSSMENNSGFDAPDRSPPRVIMDLDEP